MDSHLIRFQEKKFLFLDFETFNLNLNNEFNLPWQVATLLIETVKNSNGDIKNAVRDRQDLYLKWDTDLKIGEGARRITGYSEAKFKSRCVPQEEAFGEIYKLCEECDYIVGHNVLGFDIYLLRDWYKVHGKEYKHLPFKVIDTLAFARSIAVDYSFENSGSSLFEFQMKMLNVRKKGLRTSLGALGKSYSIDHDYDKLHDALVDLELNSKVWDKIKLQIDF
tara:strand:+ start:994 stop:1659 length:666 start_codon:yes stop_codon:yes gene_type:complete